MGLITSGYLKTCEDENRSGGIKRVYISNASQITSFTPGATEHEYTAVVMDGTAQWFRYDFEKREAEYTWEDNNENGSSEITHTVNLFLPKMEKTKATELEALRQSCDVVVIYQDFNNQAFVVGWDQFLEDEAALRPLVNGTSGRALTDANRYDLTMGGTSRELAREFNGIISTPQGLINFAI